MIPHRILRRIGVALGVLGLAWSGSVADTTAPAASAQACGLPTPGGVPATIATPDHSPGHSEPALAVDQHHSHTLLGAAMFVVTNDSGTSTLVPGTFSSVDGGHSWHNVGPLPLPAGYERGDDVSVGFAGPVGLVAAEAVSADGANTVLVWRTTDDGWSFSPPMPVFRSPPGGPGTDHPSLAIVPGDGQRDDSGPHDVVAVAWSWGPALLFSRSTDNGQTFTPPRRLSVPADGYAGLAEVVAGPRDTVAVVYRATGTTDPTTRTIRVTTSTDEGTTFAPPRSLPPGTVYGFGPQPFETSLPAATADPQTGTLYVAVSAWPGPGSSRRILVYRSTDHGRSWSAPVTLGPDATDTTTDQFQPTMTVTDHGKVYVGYLSLIKGWVTDMLAGSTDGGASFPIHLRLGHPFNPDCGLIGVWKQSPWIGDYQALTSHDTTLYAAWTDTSTATTEIAVAVAHPS